MDASRQAAMIGLLIAANSATAVEQVVTYRVDRGPAYHIQAAGSPVTLTPVVPTRPPESPRAGTACRAGCSDAPMPLVLTKGFAIDPQLLGMPPVQRPGADCQLVVGEEEAQLGASAIMGKALRRIGRWSATRAFGSLGLGYESCGESTRLAAERVAEAIRRRVDRATEVWGPRELGKQDCACGGSIRVTGMAAK